MKIEIKLNTAFGVLTPETVYLASNEGVVFTAPFSDGGLLLNGKLYVPESGLISVSRSDLRECNTCEWVKIESGSIVRKWRLNAFFVQEVDGVDRYFDELEFYKGRYKLLESEVSRLKEFRKNATTDIGNLTNAVNALNEAFKSVKEEMAL